jgi:hypothetical protein
MNFIEDEGRDFFVAMYRNHVRFMLVGGVAVNFYGYSRTTGDIDIWIEDSVANRLNLVLALKEYGITGAEAFLTHPLLAGYSELLLESGIYVDMMCELQFFKAEHFADSYEKAETFLLEDKIPLKIIHINRLIEEKKKSSRPKDRDDAEKLELILQKRNL